METEYLIEKPREELREEQTVRYVDYESAIINKELKAGLKTILQKLTCIVPNVVEVSCVFSKATFTTCNLIF